MRPLHAWSLAIALAVVGSGIGFWLGVREGANIGVMIDSAPRGSIAVALIPAIESGKAKNTLITLESDVDIALLWQSRLEEHPLYPLLDPVWGFPMADRSESLGRIADYRKEHASPLGQDAIASSEPQNDEQRAFHAQLIEGAQENQRIISRMVARYSTKTAP